MDETYTESIGIHSLNGSQDPTLEYSLLMTSEESQYVTVIVGNSTLIGFGVEPYQHATLRFV